jgi:hypothetical protein
MKLSVSPNPSYDHLNFTITLPDLAGAETANAEIIILDVRGLRVATLSVAVHAGSITIPWNMLTSSGVPLVPGVYTAILRIGASRMAIPFVVQ